MTESFTNSNHINQPEWYDRDKSPVEVDLHDKGFDIGLHSEPVVNREDAINAYGINGDIMAIITLPDKTPDKMKQIGVVDHGESFAKQPAFVLNGNKLGVSETRYALVGLNYSPNSHIFPYASLRGSRTTVGRGAIGHHEEGVDEHASYLIGLREQGNDSISRSHFTIEIGDDLRIFDHSTNHTRVFANDKQRAPGAEFLDVTDRQPRLAEAVGGIVVENSGAAIQSDIDGLNEIAAPKNARLSKLFAPMRNVPDTLDISINNNAMEDQFSQLLNATDEESAAQSRAYIESQADNWRAPKPASEPTRESLLAAARMLDAARDGDPKLGAIVDSYAEPGTTPSELIRSSTELRYKLGSYLLEEKFPLIMRESPLSMPDRIAGGSSKKTNHPGYQEFGTMSSKEYAVLLALAMLDGTFIDPGSSDPIQKYEGSSRVRIGQHRSAASTLLTYDTDRSV